MWAKCCLSCVGLTIDLLFRNIKTKYRIWRLNRSVPQKLRDKWCSHACVWLTINLLFRNIKTKAQDLKTEGNSSALVMLWVQHCWVNSSLIVQEYQCQGPGSEGWTEALWSRCEFSIVGLTLILLFRSIKAMAQDLKAEQKRSDHAVSSALLG
jgi:hypothetical protein